MYNYPLPLISELIDKLKGAHVFTKLDLQWGFNNVQIKEGDEWKAAFKMNRGMFEPLVMFFRLKNSPATFQMMMNELLKEHIDNRTVIVYMDNILIFMTTVEENIEIMKKVLEILQDNDLFLKPERCSFNQTKINYLGLIISKNGVSMDKKKIDAIISWPTLKTVKELQSFIGFANFYRQFIEDFLEITNMLHKLTRKNMPWVWNKE